MPSPTQLAILRRPTATPGPVRTRTPEEEAAIRAAQRGTSAETFTNAVDLLLGALGLADEGTAEQPNRWARGGALLSAAVPFVGPLRGLRAARTAEAVAPLAMDEASRLARAKAMGFTEDVYHATPTVFQEFDVTRNRPRYEIPGVHVGTKNAAAERAAANLDATGVVSKILPLKMKMSKPFLHPEGRPYYEDELVGLLNDVGALEAQKIPDITSRIKETFIGEPARHNWRWTEYDPLAGLRWPTPPPLGGFDAGIARAKRFGNLLTQQGHDVVPYVNMIESPGQVSYIVLRPDENLRSVFAAFDPRKIRGNLFAGLGGAAVAGTARAKQREQR